MHGMPHRLVGMRVIAKISAPRGGYDVPGHQSHAKSLTKNLLCVFYHAAKNMCLHKRFCKAVRKHARQNTAPGLSSPGKALANGLLCIFHHAAKMCACTSIFAKPSLAQPRKARTARSGEVLPLRQNPCA